MQSERERGERDKKSIRISISWPELWGIYRGAGGVIVGEKKKKKKKKNRNRRKRSDNNNNKSKERDIRIDKQRRKNTEILCHFGIRKREINKKKKTKKNGIATEKNRHKVLDTDLFLSLLITGMDVFLFFFLSFLFSFHRIDTQTDKRGRQNSEHASKQKIGCRFILKRKQKKKTNIFLTDFLTNETNP